MKIHNLTLFVIAFVLVTGGSVLWAQQTEPNQQYKRASLQETQHAENALPIQRASLKKDIKTKHPFKHHEFELQRMSGSDSSYDIDESYWGLSYIYKITRSVGLGFQYGSFKKTYGDYLTRTGPMYAGLLRASLFPKAKFDPRITLGVVYRDIYDDMFYSGGGWAATAGVDLKYNAAENLFFSAGVTVGDDARRLYGVSAGFSFGAKKL